MVCNNNKDINKNREREIEKKGKLNYIDIDLRTNNKKVIIYLPSSQDTFCS